jgi:hypothetical protein
MLVFLIREDKRGADSECVSAIYVRAGDTIIKSMTVPGSEGRKFSAKREFAGRNEELLRPEI